MLASNPNLAKPIWEFSNDTAPYDHVWKDAVATRSVASLMP